MKKLYLFVSVVVLVVACAPPTNRQASSSSTNLANNSVPLATPSDADVIAREKATWEAIKNKDYERFASFLAEDQLEVGDEGVWDKAAAVANVKLYEFSEIGFADWKVLPLDQDLVVTTYTVSLKGKRDGKEFPPGDFRASSAWVNRNGKWQAIFYQECPALKMPAPSPNASPAKAPSPTTSASPPTTSSDAVANEKIVWELFKARNYDAFASLVDPKALEVNPYGVFDREGSIQGVQTFDASKGELSDFRTVDIDKDATLVTYLVRISGPKPEVERHSTIWMDRGGKWMAVFHHGTPVRQPSEAK